MRYFVLAMLVGALVLHLATNGLTRGHAPIPDPGTPRTPAPAHANPSSVVAPERDIATWLPDGRLWIKATDESGGTLACWAYCWAPLDSRQVIATVVQADSDGWVTLDPGPQMGTSLMLGAPHRQTQVVADVHPSRRLAVVLEESETVDFCVRDVETQHPVLDVHVFLSKTALNDATPVLPQADPERITLPGPDPATAIVGAASGPDGRLRIAFPRSTQSDIPWNLAVTHDYYMMARTQRDQIPEGVRGEHIVEVQMPAVGAIRYEGGEILQQALRSQHAPLPEHVRRNEADALLAIRRRLIANRADVAAVAFLPELTGFDWGTSKVTAHVTLRRGGDRVDTMQLVRYRDYTGPQIVSCDMSLPEVITSQVLLRPPKTGAFSIADPRWRVIVSGDNKFRPVTCRLGDTIELPVGQYRIKTIFEGSGALKPLVYEVVGTGSEEFVTELRNDVYLYEVQIQGRAGTPHVQFRVSRGGQRFIIDATCDEGGTATFWSQYDYGEADLFVPGWMEERVVFPPGPIGSTRRSHCMLLTRRPQGVVPR